MSTTPKIQHPTRVHPLTGRPLEAAGVLPNGRIVWPILGGDDTVPPAPAVPAPPTAPTRPEGVEETEWNALGDPGRKALVRERERADAAERALAASRARPAAPPKPEAPAAPAAPAKPEAPKSGELDIAAIVQQAVDAAVKPFREAEEQRTTQQAAEKIRTSVLDAAKTRLHDATDALANVDLTTVVNDQGQADPARIKTALDDLVSRKPHLAKSGERIAPPGIGGGAPAGATDADKVKAVLADMQRATGVRPPAVTGTTL